MFANTLEINYNNVYTIGNDNADPIEYNNIESEDNKVNYYE
ncbi:hypothetical protein [Staphylococcus gallinarum]|nr:hypothetical protein [Staphylococcus gallinarum]